MYLLTRYIAVIERVFFVMEVLLTHSSDRVCILAIQYHINN